MTGVILQYGWYCSSGVGSEQLGGCCGRERCWSLLLTSVTELLRRLHSHFQCCSVLLERFEAGQLLPEGRVMLHGDMTVLYTVDEGLCGRNFLQSVAIN